MNKLKLTILVAIACLTLAYVASIINVPSVQGATSRQSEDSCGHITVVKGSVQESPSCPNDVGNANSYQTTLKVVSNTPISHFDWVWKTFWCSNTNQLNSHGYCVSNLRENAMGTTNLQPNVEYTFTSQNRTPDAPFASCGIFQNDFYFFYTLNGVKCQSGSSSQSMVAAGGVCSTTQPNCPVPTETPFPTSTPTPTPTEGPSATPTPTPGNNNTNNCNSTKQAGSGNNNNSNCNQNNNQNTNSNNQNQKQSQDQTQNNNQEQNFNPSINNTNNNNITFSSYAPPVIQQQQQVQVQPAPTTTSLPSTGSPLIDLIGLFSASGAGILIRRFTKIA